MARNAGEEIFESLGEERTVVEESQFVIETKESENIQTQHLAPAAAFEYFHGKIYETSQREKTDYSLADQVEKRVESPFQRFARLRAELQELQSDVAVMLQDDQKHSKPYENIWSTLQQETNHLLHNLNDLNGQINQLSAHEQPINSSTQSLERLAKQAASLASTDSLNNSQNQTKSLESHSPLSTLELRIAALESLLGSASNSLDLEGFVGVTVHGRSFPLLEKLTLLERKVNMLDPTTLESIRTKAHTLKSELEEIQRERLRSGGAAHKVLESAKKIETLYDNV